MQKSGRKKTRDNARVKNLDEKKPAEAGLG
jgi:hypothetical protein